MSIPSLIIIICWATIILFWLVSSFSVKRDVGGGLWGWQSGLWMRIAIVAVMAILVHFFSPGLFSGNHIGTVLHYWSLTDNSALAALGSAVCVIGIALAIWARLHLGRNWSSHPTLKENHELVTSGPYALIRHPIYTGLMLATLGTGLVSSPWLVIFLIMSVTFVHRVKKEEQLMMKQFPNQYPEYRKRTWALVPWVW